MLGDPRDRVAYRIAIASIGLALAVVLAGVCTIAAVGRCVPRELWFICSAISGLLGGTLIPFSLRNAADPGDATQGSRNTPPLSPEGALALLVLVAAVAAVCFGVTLPVQMLGVALGGLILGLLIPSPSRWDR